MRGRTRRLWHIHRRKRHSRILPVQGRGSQPVQEAGQGIRGGTPQHHHRHHQHRRCRHRSAHALRQEQGAGCPHRGRRPLLRRIRRLGNLPGLHRRRDPRQHQPADGQAAQGSGQTVRHQRRPRVRHPVRRQRQRLRRQRGPVASGWAGPGQPARNLVRVHRRDEADPAGRHHADRRQPRRTVDHSGAVRLPGRHTCADQRILEAQRRHRHIRRPVGSRGGKGSRVLPVHAGQSGRYLPAGHPGLRQRQGGHLAPGHLRRAAWSTRTST
jgi:hypothetical protein